jgi:hypothetical protein
MSICFSSGAAALSAEGVSWTNGHLSLADLGFGCWRLQNLFFRLSNFGDRHHLPDPLKQLQRPLECLGRELLC